MINNPSKKLGVIVGVDGDVSQVGMYNLSNDAQYIWYGDILTGPKIGAYLTINQNDIKIIATVSSEKVIDQQNNVRSTEFDNRYQKGSINRIISLKTKGVIEDGKFQVTSQYVPMIGNEITLTSKEELGIIYGIEKGDASIYIGKSLLEGQPINLPINRFFASHIGLFGNTGSGKSNTLHKLFLELFRSEYYPNRINETSQFFVIDFNGEYVGKEMFSVDVNDKKIYEIVTNSRKTGDKIPVKQEYLFDEDILSILFDARPATQVPFLRKAIRFWNEKKFDGNSFAELELGLLKAILTQGKAISPDAKEHWISIAKNYVKAETLQIIEELRHSVNFGTNQYETSNYTFFEEQNQIPAAAQSDMKFDIISSELSECFNNASQIGKLQMFLSFQKVYVSAWNAGKTQVEFLQPLFSRIDTAFASLEKVVDVVDDISNKYKTMNIISLVHANQEITRLIPMLLSKMIYVEQKNAVAGNAVQQTKHLIIDEAHNILNSDFKNTGDDWHDYRLSVFEEIIKEGRKFGFYLTLSSQRPADISPTILSQTHNYIVHRLVNEKDLRMLENTMPTLDKSSYQMIPSLGQGEAIVTGNAMTVPVFVKVEKEEITRPSSDDIILTDLWEEEVDDFDLF